eukprot:SAG31_NODE_6875_length_1863_cov_1.834467_3_plen_134_part_01
MSVFSSKLDLQVAIVRSHAAKSHAKKLGFALVLTVLEAKGLEFDDVCTADLHFIRTKPAAPFPHPFDSQFWFRSQVFLINFFRDSPATQDHWRVINSYMKRKAPAGDAFGADEEVPSSLRPVKDFEQNISTYNC